MTMIRAAGGVVWRRAEAAHGATVEIAVVHRPRYDDWSLPKGKLAPGEAELDGGVREVLEETGQRVRVGRSLGETAYLKLEKGEERPKVVTWWAMEAIGGSFTPNREVDELRWLSLGEAESIVTRPTDRELLGRFAHGPAPTRTVLLVRHASAGSRAAWAGEDRRRPLDAVGAAQADALVRHLARYDIGLVASADVLRCEQTVEPLAAALSIAVRPEALFSEVGYPGREAEAIEALRGLGPPAQDAVICSQGDVIPDLVSRIAAADGIELERAVAAKKASTWALTLADRQLVAAEYQAPPAVEAPGAAGVAG